MQLFMRTGVAAVLAMSGLAYAEDAAPEAAPAEAPAVEAAPAEAAPAADPSLDTLEKKASYAIGLDIGRNIKAQPVAFDPDLIVQGIHDALSGAQPKLTEAQIMDAMTALRTQIMAQQEEIQRNAGAKNLAEGKALMDANGKAEGVTTTASGLQIKTVEEGKGESPKATDTVTVHYKGTLIDGQQFDSSYDRNEPATFPLHGVIPGWTEGLQLMKVGGKYRLWIPSHLAYRESGAPGSPIGPNATLIFDIELIGIEAPTK